MRTKVLCDTRPLSGPYGPYGLSGQIIPPSNQLDLISRQKGLGLAYHKSECLGIVQIVQPRGTQLFGIGRE